MTSRAAIQDTDKVFNGACILSQNDRCVVIGSFAFWFRIDSSELKFLPHLLQQFVNVPAVLGTDGAGIGYSIKQVKFLDGDGIYFVESINDGNIASAFDFQNIYQIIDSSIAANGNVRRRYLVLAHHRFDLLLPVSGIRQRLWIYGHRGLYELEVPC